jgi:hypothetical protein
LIWRLIAFEDYTFTKNSSQLNMSQYYSQSLGRYVTREEAKVLIESKNNTTSSGAENALRDAERRARESDRRAGISTSSSSSVPPLRIIPAQSSYAPAPSSYRPAVVYSAPRPTPRPVLVYSAPAPRPMFVQYGPRPTAVFRSGNGYVVSYD